MGSEGQGKARRRPYVKADLTADEKKQLRQIAAHLKGAQ